MKRAARVGAPTLLLLLFALATWSCAGRAPMRGNTVSGLDRKLSTFVYIEEGDIVSFIVGTRAARYRDKTDYMPLEIGIANRGLKQLALTRESFTLIDSEGRRYPAASPRELIEGYDFLDLDRNSLAELEGIVFNKFAAFTRYGSKFSPTRGVGRGVSGSLVRDSVVLPRFGYLLDFVYFPKPAGGIKGQEFELFLEAPELSDPVFVKFRVD